MASAVIYISPSSQVNNSCIIGDSEQDHTRLLGAEIYRLLSQDPRLKVGLCPIVEGSTDNQRLGNAVWYSNKFMEENGGNVSGVPAFHICLHTDAYNGSVTGVSAFYIGSGTSKKLATNIYNELLNCGLGWNGRSLREWAGLYELKNTTASAVLIENNFHDVYSTAKQFHDNINKIATCYCVAIYNTIGIDRYIPPVVTPPVVTPPVVTPEDNDTKWKKELIQKCIDSGYLEDVAWLSMYDESIPVFAVCKMLLKIEAKYKNDLETLAKSIIISEITNVKGTLVDDAMKVITGNVNDMFVEDEIKFKVIKKK